jgi:hypothetical protein
MDTFIVRLAFLVVIGFVAYHILFYLPHWTLRILLVWCLIREVVKRD